MLAEPVAAGPAPLDGGAEPERLPVEALLVTKLVNIRYLTGFTGSAALLAVLPDEVVLITDGRYGQQAAEQLARPASRPASRWPASTSARCWAGPWPTSGVAVGWPSRPTP